MAKFQFVKGTTSQNVLIFIQDASSPTGAGLTGLVFNTASLTCYYYRENQGTGATQMVLVTATIGTWVTLGFVEIDATDMPGWYELGIPDAALATGADFVGIQLKGAANMAQINLEIQLTGVDLNNATSGGIADIASCKSGIIESTTKSGTLTVNSASTNLTGYDDDQIIGRIVTFVSGVTDGESVGITDYATINGVLTFETVTIAPEAGDSIKIT